MYFFTGPDTKWHLVLTQIETRRLQQTFGGASSPGMEWSVSINAFSDIVTFTVMMEPDENPFSAVGAALGLALVPSTVEPMLNGILSDFPHDPYATLVPHRVRVISKYPDFQTLERMRSAREKAKEDALQQEMKAQEAKLEEIRAYVMDNLSIENLRASSGSRTGYPPYQDMVEGAIVNQGKKSLKKVKVRFYFLDS